MAASITRASFICLRCKARAFPRPNPPRPSKLFPSPRPFHHTSIYREKRTNPPEDEDEDGRPPSSLPKDDTNIPFPDTLHPEDRIIYDSLSPTERSEFEREARTIDAEMNSPESTAMVDREIASAADKAEAEFDRLERSSGGHSSSSIDGEDSDSGDFQRYPQGLMALGEDDPIDTGEDEDFQGDDISSLAHGELEQHRELRSYARIAAWEMPLLSKLAKPFTPPGLDAPLRFRHTTYMGETHPAERKVVLEFCTGDIPGLTEQQRLKLIKLAGVRYNPQTDVVKMSSEVFETGAQNKRYLGDLVDRLIAEVKEGKDRLEDVPVDFRHHKWKVPPVFPDGWKLTEGRRERLTKEREKRAVEEGERRVKGEVVDGVRVIEEAVRRFGVQESPVMVEAGRGKGKAKDKVRRRLL
ncbi:37S ribosomal protein S24, mitochondrial [Loxospora ochrophaea]|nr:37S ribosomal protein S24, mitochondrial [Loxospora ochrophaea]